MGQYFYRPSCSLSRPSFNPMVEIHGQTLASLSYLPYPTNPHISLLGLGKPQRAAALAEAAQPRPSRGRWHSRRLTHQAGCTRHPLPLELSLSHLAFLSISDHLVFALSMPGSTCPWLGSPSRVRMSSLSPPPPNLVEERSSHTHILPHVLLLANVDPPPRICHRRPPLSCLNLIRASRIKDGAKEEGVQRRLWQNYPNYMAHVHMSLF